MKFQKLMSAVLGVIGDHLVLLKGGYTFVYVKLVIQGMVNVEVSTHFNRLYHGWLARLGHVNYEVLSS